MKHEAMKQAAEQRRHELNQLQEAERKKKQDILEKKQSLKKVQDQDAMAKMEFKNRQSKLSRQQDDFNEKNILSYVYETKVNKSHEYDQKKQANISKIIENFPMQSKIDQYNKVIAGSEQGFNPTQGPSN